jgi:hypothetical protein
VEPVPDAIVDTVVSDLVVQHDIIEPALQEQIEKIRERNVPEVAEKLVEEVCKDRRDNWEKHAIQLMADSIGLQLMTEAAEAGKMKIVVEGTPFPDVYSSLEKIREDIAAILRDGTLSYTQTLQQMQSVVDKMDKTISQGKFIADGTRE